ncbi:MAG: SprT family zinc-dependent metalloprotease [Coriobacteriia bacterium]|nr:SprT family zinc-dependent metalloprotease [Coriobacteriia bacterium]
MSAETFSYTLRESPRARYVRIRVTARDGLVVVVPRGFPPARVPALLVMRSHWIERALGRVEAQRVRWASQLAAGAPAVLGLRAVGEEWRVEYRRTGARGVTAREHAGRRLVVSGDVGDSKATRDAVKRWLSRRAKATLAPALLGKAEEHGYPVKRVTLRWQRSRWGSCSPTGTISLNTQLLFLPAALAGYVLLHELCHTVRMDHSAEFWALVAAHEPDYRERKREVRDGWEYVPAWLQTE